MVGDINKGIEKVNKLEYLERVNQPLRSFLEITESFADIKTNEKAVVRTTDSIRPYLRTGASLFASKNSLPVLSRQQVDVIEKIKEGDLLCQEGKYLY